MMKNADAIHRERLESMKTTRAGWLAPNGKFYLCLPYEHDNAAYDLHPHGPSAIENTHLRVEHDGYVIMGGYSLKDVEANSQRVTQAQLDTLQDLLSANANDQTYVDNLNYSINYFLEMKT